MSLIEAGSRYGLETILLTDPSSGSRAELAPARGALLLSLQKNGREFIWLDPENLISAERPRCGMPVLFPCCGRTVDETAWFDGSGYPMPIHGFAHTSAWETAHCGGCPGGGSEAVLRLEDSDATRRHYPFAFLLELTFRLQNGALTVLHRCVNTGSRPMPFDLGYHPYFRMSSLENAVFSVPGQAEGFRLPPGPETGRSFVRPKRGAQYTDTKTSRQITVEQTANFDSMVFWSVPDKGFVCVEPWQGRPNGLNNGSCRLLAPGDTASGSICITPSVLYRADDQI